MAGILSYFLPKDKVFYSLFEKASDNLESIAQKLLQVVHESDYNKRAALIEEMRDIEHQNDNITHQIFIELGKNFITPFDREDIHSLASALDDIADYIYASGKKINFYKIDPISDQGIQKTAIAGQWPWSSRQATFLVLLLVCQQFPFPCIHLPSKWPSMILVCLHQMSAQSEFFAGLPEECQSRLLLFGGKHVAIDLEEGQA